MTKDEFDDWLEFPVTVEFMKILAKSAKEDEEMLTADGDFNAKMLPFINRLKGALQIKRMITNPATLGYALYGTRAEEEPDAD